MLDVGGRRYKLMIIRREVVLITEKVGKSIIIPRIKLYFDCFINLYFSFNAIISVDLSLWKIKS